MRMRSLAALFMSLLVLTMVGCSGDVGGGGGTTVPQVGAALSGVASKGPIRNGHIQIFEIDATSRLLSPTPFFTGTTGADGSFSTNLPASLTKGGVMIKVVDGDYNDEATGTEKNIQTEFGASGMRSVFGNISSAVKQGSVSMNVTPYTKMAVSDMNNVYDDSTTKRSQDKIQHAFGFDAKGIDIVRTKPLDSTKAFPAGSPRQNSSTAWQWPPSHSTRRISAPAKPFQASVMTCCSITLAATASSISRPVTTLRPPTRLCRSP